jgi:hypothetical protein
MLMLSLGKKLFQDWRKLGNLRKEVYFSLQRWVQVNIRYLRLRKHMTEGNLATEKYTEAAVTMAEANKDFVIGFICNKPISSDPSFLYITPGVQLQESCDTLGQVQAAFSMNHIGSNIERQMMLFPMELILLLWAEELLVLLIFEILLQNTEILHGLHTKRGCRISPTFSFQNNWLKILIELIQNSYIITLLLIIILEH